jgi:hypothetical protein
VGVGGAQCKVMFMNSNQILGNKSIWILYSSTAS